MDRPVALLAAALMAATLALAGCAGSGAPGGDGSGANGATVTQGDGAGLPPPSLQLPQWAVGDAWTYDFNGARTTYVITSETANDWIMETDSEERSFSDLREDVSRLGPQRKSDLAGSQDGDRVEFFRWPLTDGAQWSTTWDHQPVTIQALVLPDRADLTATDAAGNLVYRYSYEPASRWFTSLVHYGPDGRELVSLTLTEARHAWSGTVVHWELLEVVQDEGSDGAAAGGPFEVPAGATDIWADYHFTCSGGAGYLVAVEPLNPGLAGPQGKEHSGQCVQVDWTDPMVTGPHPGTWAFTIDMGGQTADYEYTLLVRTRVDVAFPG